MIRLVNSYNLNAVKINSISEKLLSKVIKNAKAIRFSYSTEVDA